MSLYLKNLFGKLNETTRAALEGATALCVSRGHVHIEIEHYLSSLLPLRNTDLARICARFEIDTARLELELQRTDLLIEFEPSYRLVKEVEQKIAQTRASIAGEDRAGTRAGLR